jgi:hypothetical protein
MRDKAVLPLFVDFNAFKPHIIDVKDAMWFMGNFSSRRLSLEAGIA